MDRTTIATTRLALSAGASKNREKKRQKSEFFCKKFRILKKATRWWADRTDHSPMWKMRGAFMIITRNLFSVQLTPM